MTLFQRFHASNVVIHELEIHLIIEFELLLQLFNESKYTFSYSCFQIVNIINGIHCNCTASRSKLKKFQIHIIESISHIYFLKYLDK